MLQVKDIKALDSMTTPFYYYDMDLFRRTVEEMASLSAQYGIKFHYALKANASPRLLSLLCEAGFGADCVSGNEVLHAVRNGFPASKVMFAGVGKTDREIKAAIEAGIGCFNVESVPELENINRIASEMGTRASVAFRVNPNVDAHTHKYITTGLEENKFGISDYEFDSAIECLAKCSSLDFKGIQVHVGSQITDVEGVFSLTCEKVRSIVELFESKGVRISTVDFGGGLGVDYENPDANPVADFKSWLSVIRKHFPMDCAYEIHLEPGRSVVAQCGSLITRVVYVKHGQRKNFLITDAGMNDLIRPALYSAYHRIENLSAASYRNDEVENHPYDVVGPVCESSDVWGEGRMLPESERGDLLAIRTAGAYGQVMASQYNLRDLAEAVYSDDIQ